MPEKLRIKSLSPRWLKPFKLALFIAYTVIFAFIVYPLSAGKAWYQFFLSTALYAYIFYRLLKSTAKIYRVEFDDNCLYIIQKSNDLLIPLENIKSVELKSVGGVCRVDLYYEDRVGSYFYFKPSLLYPLNYKSKDALVNLFREKIAEAKRRTSPLQKNALRS